jgi:protein Tex
VLAPGAIEGADFTTTAAVLDGVRDLLSERWAEDASLVQALREWLWNEGLFQKQAGRRQGREQRRRGQVPRLL